MISACLVIHNQASLLQRCLESIQNVVEEIVIVHDGLASEETKLSAQKYGAKFFENEYIGEAEWHRPFSIKQAKGDWILQIDADEFLSEKLKSEIRNLTKAKDIDGYYFGWPYFDGKRYIKRGPFAKTMKAALFRKDKMYLIGITHEYPRSYGKVEKRPDLWLRHEPLLDNYTMNTFRNKWIKWAKLQAKQILEIEKAPVFNVLDKDKNETFKYYQKMIQRPILNALIETMKFIMIYLNRGIIFAGSKSWVIAYLELKYLWLVRLELRRLKHAT